MAVSKKRKKKKTDNNILKRSNLKLSEVYNLSSYEQAEKYKLELSSLRDCINKNMLCVATEIIDKVKFDREKILRNGTSDLQLITILSFMRRGMISDNIIAMYMVGADMTCKSLDDDRVMKMLSDISYTSYEKFANTTMINMIYGCNRGIGRKLLMMSQNTTAASACMIRDFVYDEIKALFQTISFNDSQEETVFISLCRIAIDCSNSSSQQDFYDAIKRGISGKLTDYNAFCKEVIVVEKMLKDMESEIDLNLNVEKAINDVCITKKVDTEESYPNVKDIICSAIDIKVTKRIVINHDKSFKNRTWKDLNRIAEDNGYSYVRSNGGHGVYKDLEGNFVIIPQGRCIGKGLQLSIIKAIQGVKKVEL